jgi:hypothetical protein
MAQHDVKVDTVANEHGIRLLRMHAGGGMVNLKHFLAAALPRDFGHWIVSPDSAERAP